MKRRGLTRVVALATVVSMMSVELSVSATSDIDTGTAAEGTADTTAESDGTGETTSTNAETTATDAGTSAGKEDDSTVGNERLEHNYAVVSKGYKYPVYTGSPIVYSAQDTFDAETSTALLVTDKSKTHDYGESVVELGLNDEGEELPGKKATFKLNVEKAGVYAVAFDYITNDEDSILVPELSFSLNGEIPFFECNRLIYENCWTPEIDSDTNKPIELKDRYGNQIVASPVKVMKWQKKYVMDASYRYSTPLLLQLEEGENVIELTLTEGSLMIGNIYLDAGPEYEEVKTSNSAEGNSDIITAQGEDSLYKNDSSIRATCEYDPGLSPYDAKKKVLNMIDDASFVDAGQSLTYSFDVKEAGYYYLAFNYRQTGRIDMPVFMDIVIDKQLFITDDQKSATNDRLTSYPFDYVKSFKNMTVTDADGKKMAIYFEAGTHTITTTISNEHIRSTLQVIDQVMSEINDLSLEVSRVSSTTDKYRDIKITDYVPDIEKRLARWIDSLKKQYDELAEYSTEDGNIGALSALNLAIEKLESLAEEPNKIPYRIKELSTSSSSANQYLANLITDLTKNSISFDRIYLYQEGKELPGKASIFSKIWGAILRFLSSFDSQSYSVDNSDDSHLQVWINRPRQYLEIIQRMIDTEFTAKTGIQVDLSIMPDAQKLILSNAAGTSPDVAQAVDYALPIEFALRDAAVDLTKFDGAKELMELFPAGLFVPSTMNNGIYSIPETFYFWVLFYRTDVLTKLDIEIPDTMDDVEELLPELKNRGLDFYYPTAGTTGQRTFAMTTPLLYQNGASLYDTNAGDTTLDSEKAIEGLTRLTELFTIYDLPPEITNFYQHFRNGDIPIGVADYFMYSQLINAAPEIENSWGISLVPGLENNEGVVQRQTAGAAQSSMILKTKRDTKVASNNGDMDRDEAAWEYLKWWMSTETQVEFGITLQTTYGQEYIWNSANMEAFASLPWKSRDKQTILTQMENIQETPRIPGTYMLERELSNVYVEVVMNGGILRTELDGAIKRIDRETERKLKEFGYMNSLGESVKDYIVPSVKNVKDIISQLH